MSPRWLMVVLWPFWPLVMLWWLFNEAGKGDK